MTLGVCLDRVCSLSLCVTLACLMGEGRPSAQALSRATIEQEGGSEIRVSLRPEDATWGRLISVSRTLRAQRPNWEGQIWFFTAPSAAQQFSISVLVEPPISRDTYKKVRAIYFFDRTTRREYLDLLLFGWAGEMVRDARVELFDSTTPPCPYQLARRCVLAMDDLPTVGKDIAGTAVVAARITRRGRLADARIVDTQLLPGAESSRMTRSILQSLRTWQVEPGAQASNIRIVFGFGAPTPQPLPTASELATTTPSGVHISADVR